MRLLELPIFAPAEPLIERIMARLIHNHSYFQQDLMDESESDSFSSVVFQNELNFGNSNREQLSKVRLVETMKKANVRPVLVENLILDYFIKNGLLEEAKIFAGESGLSLENFHEHKVQNLCQQITNRMSAHKIEETIALLDSVSPDILKNNPLLELKIRCFGLKLMKNFDSRQLNEFVKTEFLRVLQRENKGNIHHLQSIMESFLGKYIMKNEFSFELSKIISEIVKEVKQKLQVRDSSKIEEIIFLLGKMQKLIKKNSKINLGSEDLTFCASKLIADRETDIND